MFDVIIGRIVSNVVGEVTKLVTRDAYHRVVGNKISGKEEIRKEGSQKPVKGGNLEEWI